MGTHLQAVPPGSLVVFTDEVAELRLKPLMARGAGDVELLEAVQQYVLRDKGFRPTAFGRWARHLPVRSAAWQCKAYRGQTAGLGACCSPGLPTAFRRWARHLPVRSVAWPRAAYRGQTAGWMPGQLLVMHGCMML